MTDFEEIAKAAVERGPSELSELEKVAIAEVSGVAVHMVANGREVRLETEPCYVGWIDGKLHVVSLLPSKKRVVPWRISE